MDHMKNFVPVGSTYNAGSWVAAHIIDAERQLTGAKEILEEEEKKAAKAIDQAKACVRWWADHLDALRTMKTAMER